METPANLGSDFPLNLFMVKGTPVSRLKFSSLRWFGFNKPKEHDEHFFELLVPGFEKICIHIYSYMFIYIYTYNIWDKCFNFHQSISMVPSSKLSVSSVLKRCLQNAGPKLAVGKHVKSPGVVADPKNGRFWIVENGWLVHSVKLGRVVAGKSDLFIYRWLRNPWSL